MPDDFRTTDPAEFPAAWDWTPDESDDEAMDAAEAALLERIGRGETFRREAA